MEITRKHLIFMIRLLVIISLAYLILLSPNSALMKYWGYGFIGSYLFTNLLVSYLPGELFEQQKFFYGIVLFDSLMVVAGIYIGGMASSDLYLIFFLVICLATLGAELKNLVITSMVFTSVYGWLLYRQGLFQGDMAISYALRLPFIMVISLFWGYIVDLQTKEKDRQLKISEERHRSFINNLPVGTYQHTLGPNSHFLLMNKAFLKMFGYDRVNSSSSPIGLIYANEKQKEHIRETLLVDGQIRGQAVDLLRQDGPVFNARIWARRYRLGQEDVVEGIVIDETGLTKAKEALRISEDRLKAISMSTNHLMYEWQEGEGRSIKWLGDIGDKLGYHQDVVLQTADEWQALIHPDDAHIFRELRNARKAGTTPLSMEYRVQHRDGSWQYWHDCSIPALDKNGRPQKWLGVCADMTQRKTMESQLQQAQKMESIGVLAGGVAHNFNNTLMGIKGEVAAILTGNNFHDSDYEHLKNIEEWVDKANRLTKNLLGFARGGAREVQPTDINDLIRDEDRLFHSIKKDVAIHEKLQDQLWTVKIDQNQIQQVLMNLYLNASQAMPQTGGDIYVCTENIVLNDDDVLPYNVSAGAYVQISVRDTGSGMDETTIKKIFDPFFTTKKPGVGTGLGLSSVYGIIKNHGGFIHVDSKEGQGTTFFLYLPGTNQVISDKAAAPIPKEPIRGSESILVVDDEKMVANACKRMLKQLGYKVTIVHTGEEAISLYQEEAEKFDIVLLDMMMPGMGGGELYDRLKAINPAIKTLLVSGSVADGQVQEIIDKGCNGFVQKPYDDISISLKLREVLDQKQDPRASQKGTSSKESVELIND